MSKKKIETKDDLKTELESLYSRETCYNPDKYWNPDNKCSGHCLPASLLYMDYFGGELYYINKKKHYFVKDGDNVVDLTKEQFDDELDYNSGSKVKVDNQGEPISPRYKTLKRRNAQYILLKKLLDESQGE